MTQPADSTITVKYFASLRQTVGLAQQVVPLPDPMSVGALWQQLHDQPFPDTLRAAINHEFAMVDALVNPGDEVAFFPPVTGG